MAYRASIKFDGRLLLLLLLGSTRMFLLMMEGLDMGLCPSMLEDMGRSLMDDSLVVGL